MTADPIPSEVPGEFASYAGCRAYKVADLCTGRHQEMMKDDRRDMAIQPLVMLVVSDRYA